MPPRTIIKLNTAPFWTRLGMRIFCLTFPRDENPHLIVFITACEGQNSYIINQRGRRLDSGSQLNPMFQLIYATAIKKKHFIYTHKQLISHVISGQRSEWTHIRKHQAVRVNLQCKEYSLCSVEVIFIFTDFKFILFL